MTLTYLGSNIVTTWLAPRRFRLLVFKEAKYTAMLGYQKKDIQTVIEQLAAGKLKCMIVYRAADILME
jgi:hypothetical protein